MKPTLLLGAASVLMRSKKAKLIFVGLQFGYLAYKLITRNKTETKGKQKRLAQE